MNNIFSFRRFGKLLRYDGKRFFQIMTWRLLAWCLSFYVLFFAFSFAVPLQLSIKERFDLIYVICFASAASSVSVFTKNDNHKSVSALLLPASNFEKFMSMIVFCVIVSPVLVACISFVYDAVFTLLPVGPFRHFLWEANTEMTTGMNQTDVAIYEYFAKYDSTLHAILGLFFIMAFALCGTLIFKENGSKKTFLIFIWTFLALIFIFNLFGYGEIDLGNGNGISGADVAMRNVILHFRNFIHFVLMPILLAFSYFKFKTLKY